MPSSASRGASSRSISLAMPGLSSILGGPGGGSGSRRRICATPPSCQALPAPADPGTLPARAPRRPETLARPGRVVDGEVGQPCGRCLPADSVLRGRVLSSSATAASRSASWTAQVGSLREVLAQQPVGVLVARAAATGWPSRRSTPACPSAAAISACNAISLPWSQVSDRRRCGGRSFNASMTASRTASAVCRPGRYSRIVYRLVRSTRVPIAERLASPVIRSPSQCPGDLTVGRLSRPLVDHRHVRQTTAALVRPAMRLATQPAGTQRLGQLPAQATEVRTVDRLVDGLRHDVTLGLASELGPKSLSDLLWTPPSLEPALHELAQLRVGDELARLRPCPPLLGQPLRRVRTVRRCSSDRRCAAVPGSPSPDRGPAHGRSPELLHQHGAGQRSRTRSSSDRNRAEISRFRRNTDHGRIVQPLTAAAGDCSAVSPTFARPAVDTDDPARLRVADAPRDQRGVLLPLRRLRRRTRSTSACHRNSSNPRVLR